MYELLYDCQNNRIYSYHFKNLMLETLDAEIAQEKLDVIEPIAKTDELDE
jgi:hypothetical protein